MNKSAIQAYTEWAKVELTNAVKQKAFEYGITETSISEADDVANGRVLNRTEQKQRRQLVFEIREKGYKNVVEEVTYTWFNRFIALRFMEVNGYLPSHTRVFSDDENKFNPQILKEALTVEIDGLDREIIIDYLDKNNSEGLFKYLIISQCNALNKIIPVLFEKIANYTELLFPNNLLKKDSVLDKLINDIPEEDWKDQVQILGWIYQFYIADKKDAAFKSKETITKDTLAAVTQLFTPDWIVRYMAENSLGRLWLESYPNSSLKNEMKYFVEDAPQSEEVKNKIEEIRYKDVNPENIHIIEPCCGSGHILVYVFDLLVKIYEEKGYKKSDIPTLILRNNLVGLDIDKRASQLAYFSLMMKARSVDSRLFAREEIAHPMIFEIVDSETIFEDDFEEIMSGHNFSRESINTAKYLADTFKHGKVIGSLLIVNRKDYHSFISELKEKKNDENWNIFETHFETSSINLFIRLARLAIVMSNKYDVMITNPPYIGTSSMENFMKDYSSKYYPDSKTDMFAMFMENHFIKNNGFLSMINMHSWMFLTSFEKLRYSLTNNKYFVNLIHLGAHAFESIGGEVVQTVTFIARNSKILGNGTYFRLIDAKSKENSFLNQESKIIFNQKYFNDIPGSIFGYWLSESFIKIFSSKTLKEYVFAGIGMRTGDNERFLRLWTEVDFTNIGFNLSSSFEQIQSRKRWIPYNKGGDFRKWYGNNDYVVNWFNNGEEIKENTRKVYPQLGENLSWKITNEQYYFMPGVTWTGVTTGPFNCRAYGKGFIFDSGANGLFTKNDDDKYYLMALLNSDLVNSILNVLNPTINFGAGTINRIPIVFDYSCYDKLVNSAKKCIEMAKSDWDDFETSWGFTRHPLLKYGPGKIDEIYQKWEHDKLELVDKFISEEQFINKTTNEIYGLENNNYGNCLDKYVSIKKPNLLCDIKSLISYFVGCLFGRYSLDADYIVYAGGKFNENVYKTFKSDLDNIVPICDDEYFADDLTGRFVDFIKVVFGNQYLESNLKFVSSVLGKNGNSREIIREYFVNDFYKDHLKMYQKRPIYWLFDSGKKNGFKALIYMHRYSPDLLAKMRTDYVHEQQERYRTQIANLESEIFHLNGIEKSKANKRLTKLKDQLVEINEYEEKIHHLADQMIEIDLDDGVKVNYAKFQDVLAPIK